MMAQEFHMESEDVGSVGLDALHHFTGASIFGELATVAQIDGMTSATRSGFDLFLPIRLLIVDEDMAGHPGSEFGL